MDKQYLQDLGDRVACMAVWGVVMVAVLMAIDYLPDVIWFR